jgi:hypothetical protein
MIDPSIPDEVLREVEKLSAVEQRQVMDFMRALGSARPRGTPGAELTCFAGALSEESVDEMMAAIGEGCERVGDGR